MQILVTVEETRRASREHKRQGKRVGLAPTMGSLHEGHLALVRAAKRQSDVVFVSVFVNPAQFGPGEDFANYPRDLERDRRLLETENVDVLFAPSVEEMYPAGASTFVEVGGLSERLDGRSRPGHFRGVATVVSKLFHAIEPDSAFFGQKDAAQCAVVRKLVRDQLFPVRIVICPTIREPDGLAMSSRNAYLSPAERSRALVLRRSLTTVEKLVQGGEADAAALRNAALEVFATEPHVRVDYVEVVDPDTLLPVSSVRNGALVAVAAYVGSTRLIDNILAPSRVR